MDYFIIAVLSMLTPFFMSEADIKYTPSVGIFISDNSIVNSFEATPFNRTDTSSRIISTTFAGNYNIVYDIILDYKVNLWNNKLWVAPRFSYNPLSEIFNINFQSPFSLRPTSRSVTYNENPAYGISFGYDFLSYNPAARIKPSLGLYGGISFLRVGYTSEVEAVKYDSTYKYYAGFRSELDRNWTFMLEYSRYSLDVVALRNFSQDATLTISKVKIGLAYSIRDQVTVTREAKDEVYKEVIKALDPNIEDKIIAENERLRQQRVAEIEKLGEPIITPEAVIVVPQPQELQPIISQPQGPAPARENPQIALPERVTPLEPQTQQPEEEIDTQGWNF
ncbi:hypothetical protein ABSA28_00231 [Candidatus Hepatincolaceae symbiont of Richtersius coronifer]